ncbi:MAG TPA: glycosyl hydrolase family 28-related protein [Polyangia bacterium]|nr:glycosyl hydrolase family 28-related protein [Polyangia bacterium]
MTGCAGQGGIADPSGSAGLKGGGQTTMPEGSGGGPSFAGGSSGGAAGSGGGSANGSLDAGAAGAGGSGGAPVVGGSAPPTAARGATLPYWEYEAEDATTDGVTIGPSRTFGDIAAEASGRRAVKLQASGQKITFKIEHATNSMVVRYAIPDAPNGGGAAATLGLYINGVRKSSLALTSRYSWVYGDADAQDQGSDHPSNGTPHHFYDEVHVLFDAAAAGASITLQRDAQDSAAYYVIDLVDFEWVAPPWPQPANSLSITDFGATANDGSDDGPAIQRAIDAARSQNKVLWIPPGTFESTSVPFNVSNVTIRGSGMWHSVLHGAWAQFKVSGNNNRFYDFAVFGDVVFRNDQTGNNGFLGSAGTGSRLENVWIEHEKVGWWLGKNFAGPVTQTLTDGLVVHGVRIRDTMADGINFTDATRNSVVEQSHFRNTGDDAVATWSFAANGPADCQNNTFQFNTVQAVWRATCFATYGGHAMIIQDNLCADTSNYPGIMISTTFGAIPPSGVTTVARNTIIQGGGPHYQQEFGAFRLFADQSPIASVQVSDLLIEDPTYSGIHFGGAQAATGVSLTNIEVKSAGTQGIWITSEARGSAQASGVTVDGAPAGGLQNDASDFSLQKGTGNAGW